MPVFSWLSLTCLDWIFTSRDFVRGGFLDKHFLYLVLSWNILLFPFMVIEGFAGYSNLGWHLCSVSVYIMCIRYLLALRITIDNLGVILMCLPSYVSWHIPFLVINIFSFFCAYCAFVVIWQKHFFDQTLFHVHVLLIISWEFAPVYREIIILWFCIILFQCLWSGILLLLILFWFGLFKGFQISWKFCVRTLLDIAFSLNNACICSIVFSTPEILAFILAFCF